MPGEFRTRQEEDGLWIETRELSLRVSSRLLEKEGHNSIAGAHECKVEAVKQLEASAHFCGFVEMI